MDAQETVPALGRSTVWSDRLADLQRHRPSTALLSGSPFFNVVEVAPGQQPETACRRRPSSSTGAPRTF